MASVQSILVLFGEVDRLVVEAPDDETRDRRQEAVAAVLGAYKHPSTPGWYEKFTRWLNDAGIQPRPTVLPDDVRDALDELADVNHPPTGRAQARLLLAIAALGRADPGWIDDDERRTRLAGAVRPLVPEAPDEEIDRDGRADGLVQLLANSGNYEGVFPTLEAWQQMLEVAFARGFISAELKQQVDPPCQAGFSEPAGASGPVASLKTELVTKLLTFDQATGFLDPSRWPDCTALWCRMDPLPGGPPRRFLEVIGLDCDDLTRWRLKTCLEFENRTLPGIRAATADYRLAADQTGADRLVEVDEGSITVIDEVTHIRIVTVKRLRFRGLYLQAGMAALMCALGYASVGEEMVYSCALMYPLSTPWDPGSAKTPAPGGLVGALVGEVVDLTVACVNENAEAMKASTAAAARGEYTLEHLTRDATRMWLRPLQDMARLSQVVLGQCADVPQSGMATQVVVSSPVTFDNLPGPCTFRLAGGRLTGPFGRTIPATVDAPGGGPAVTVKATVGAELSGTFWGLIEACGAPGGPAVAVRPVVLVVP
jgi:hypothetical protein